jgi:hypothetical protein
VECCCDIVDGPGLIKSQKKDLLLVMKPRKLRQI